MTTELATINRTGFHISETPSESYTLPQIAELLNANPSTVRNWVTLGRLPARKEGRRWVVDREYVEELMTTRRSQRRSSSRRSTHTTSAANEPLGAQPEPGEKRVGRNMARDDRPRLMADQFGTVDEAVLHVRRADARWEAAVQAFDAYPDRLGRLAEAAEQERKALLFAEVCNVQWRPLDAGPDFSLAQDLDPGNRPGPDSVWTEFDQAVKQIGAALGGDGHAALAVTFGKLAAAVVTVAAKLEELGLRQRETG